MRVALLLLVCVPLGCAAEVYKCTKDGAVGFQDHPCEGRLPRDSNGLQKPAIRADDKPVAQIEGEAILAEIKAAMAANNGGAVCRHLGRLLRVDGAPNVIEMVRKAGFHKTVKLTDDELDLMKLQAVYVGMSKCGVLGALGLPRDINRTTTRNSENEQWVYNGRYVYFENDIVTGYQSGY